MNHCKKTLFLVLLLCLFSLMTYSYLMKNTYDPYFSYRLTHYEAYKNESFVVSGRIQETYPANNTMRIEISQPPYCEVYVTTAAIPTCAKQGDHIEISADFVEPNVLHAQEMIITDSFHHSLIYLRSLPAIPFAVYLFFKRWCFNTNKFCFERRNE